MSESFRSRAPLASLLHNTASTAINTSAWVQLISATAKASAALQVYNGSTSTIKLAIGASSSEVEIPFYIAPGMTQLVPLPIAKGVRLSGRAVDANATSGVLVFNFFG